MFQKRSAATAPAALSFCWSVVLLTGDPETVHAAGISMRHKTVPEFEVDEDDWEDHIIDD